MLEERLANLTEKSEASGTRAQELEAAHSVLVDKVAALEELSASQQALIEELREGVRQKVCPAMGWPLTSMSGCHSPVA